MICSGCKTNKILIESFNALKHSSAIEGEGKWFKFVYIVDGMAQLFIMQVGMVGVKWKALVLVWTWPFSNSQQY